MSLIFKNKAPAKYLLLTKIQTLLALFRKHFNFNDINSLIEPENRLQIQKTLADSFQYNLYPNFIACIDPKKIYQASIALQKIETHLYKVYSISLQEFINTLIQDPWCQSFSGAEIFLLKRLQKAQIHLNLVKTLLAIYQLNFCNSSLQTSFTTLHIPTRQIIFCPNLNLVTKRRQLEKTKWIELQSLIAKLKELYQAKFTLRSFPSLKQTLNNQVALEVINICHPSRWLAFKTQLPSRYQQVYGPNIYYKLQPYLQKLKPSERQTIPIDLYRRFGQIVLGDLQTRWQDFFSTKENASAKKRQTQLSTTDQNQFHKSKILTLSKGLWQILPPEVLQIFWQARKDKNSKLTFSSRQTQQILLRTLNFLCTHLDIKHQYRVVINPQALISKVDHKQRQIILSKKKFSLNKLYTLLFHEIGVHFLTSNLNKELNRIKAGLSFSHIHEGFATILEKILQGRDLKKFNLTDLLITLVHKRLLTYQELVTFAFIYLKLCNPKKTDQQVEKLLNTLLFRILRGTINLNYQQFLSQKQNLWLKKQDLYLPQTNLVYPKDLLYTLSRQRWHIYNQALNQTEKFVLKSQDASFLENLLSKLINPQVFLAANFDIFDPIDLQHSLLPALHLLDPNLAKTTPQIWQIYFTFLKKHIL